MLYNSNMKNNQQPEKHTPKTDKNQQLILPMGISFLIPEDAPVRLLWEVLEEMDFTALEKDSKPRKNSVALREMTAILVFGAMNQKYSTRKIEEACKNDIRFMWLLGAQKAPDHSVISRFRKEKLPMIMDSIFKQLMDYLHKLGEIDYKTVFVDGTKLEANANRYSFVWKKSVEKHLVRLKEKALKYVENLDAEKREEIELSELKSYAQKAWEKLIKLGIPQVSGKGKRKDPLQRQAEELQKMADKWAEYEKHLEIIGEDRNSYSKTDRDATFMRMKDDHMKNGQLKAGYNVQIGVNSEYIVGYDVYQDRSDSGTLIPFLEAMKNLHGRKYKSITADAGYESQENYETLEQWEQLSFIKPANYERSKKKNKKWIGRYEDMEYNPLTDAFTCKAGKCLDFTGKCTRRSKTGYERVVSIYTCNECTGCPLRDKCSRAKDERTKQLQVCWTFERYRSQSLANITDSTGIKYRVNRSIQVEGAFGVIKQDWGFRRFLLRGLPGVKTEIGLLAFAFNIKKLHAKRENDRLGTQLFEVDTA